MSSKRAWCPSCSSKLGAWRATEAVAELDARAHAIVTGHATEVWHQEGRVLLRLPAEPSLPLWEPVERDD